MEELIQRISGKLKRGYPAGELKEDLLKEGFTSREIEDAFFAVSGARQAKHASAPEAPLWYYLSFGLLILGVALRTVPALWLSPLGYPFIIIGVIGIAIRLITVNQKKT